MNTEAPAVPPRKKLSVLWILLGTFLLLIAFFCFQLFGPSPSIVVSRQTTYITKPLGSDGLPDYKQYVLDAQRRGVTPQNNAAVLMWQAMGPDGLDRKHWALVAKELGVPVPAPATLLAPLYGRPNRARIYDWLEHNAADWKPAPETGPAAIASMNELGLTQEQLDVEGVISAAQSAPWRSEDLPPLADWVRENQTQLDMLVAASDRSHFYFPSPTLLDDSTDSLVSMLLPEIQQSREVARLISTRAMWHLGEGRLDDAWHDLRAVHRWARLLGQNDTLIGQLVASAIDGIAIHGTTALLADPRLTPELAREIEREVTSLKPATHMADTFDGMERFMFLDIVVRGHRSGMGSFLTSLADTDSTRSFHPLNYISVDWNVALLNGNKNFDQLAAAFRLSDHAARVNRLQQIQSSLSTSQPGGPSSDLIGLLLSQSKRSDLLSLNLTNGLTSTDTACATAEDRGNTRLELLRLTAALAVYRAEHGAYPQTPDALVPDVLPQLPIDIYNKNPFVYQRDGAGYLLYSCGEDGNDDGGSNEQMNIVGGRSLEDSPEGEADAARKQLPSGADDVSVRVPVAPFTIPKPPAADGEQ